MKVRVRLFAVLEQTTGRQSVEVEMPEGGTIAGLRAALTDQWPALAPLTASLLFAINSQYAGPEVVVDPRAEIACIPPVSGG